MATACLAHPLADDIKGLSSVEALGFLKTFGLNEPATERGPNQLVRFLKIFLQPLPAILLIAAVISFAIGQPVDAAIIASMIVISAGVDFYQSYRSSVAVERLRNLVAPQATVYRDGSWKDIDRRYVVPGDVVGLSAGDLIPADCLLLSTRDLHVLEAVLTGESIPSPKDEVPGTDPRMNRVYLGTSVASGTAVARVLNTGRHTEFGDIAARLRIQQEETSFDKGLRQFAYLISRVVFFLVFFVLLANLAMHRNPYESVLFAVALAVGLTPELLPVLTSVTLANAAWKLSKKEVIVKHLSAIQNLGSIDILCSDKTGTLTTGLMSVVASIDSLGNDDRTPLCAAALNASFETGVRSPLDAAILAAQSPEQGFIKCDELPFDFQRRRLSVILEKDGVRQLISKLSPESVLAVCVTVHDPLGPIPLTEERRDQAQRIFDSYSEQGYRLLAVARSTVTERGTYELRDESDLELLGFVAFADPPREGAAEAIRDLARDGVSIKVITGDHPAVARHLCSSIGIRSTEVLLGDEIETLSDIALGVRAEQTNIFARVSPIQKTRILHALRAHGHVVGFIGDGINDSPSLRAADVGIAAPNAVDVARSAADIILTKPGYAVLHEAIREGRSAFGNVMKYLMMGTSSNFGNVLSMAAAALTLPFLPMLPTQVLLNNFLYDLSQLTIPSDNVDREYLRTPRRWDMNVVKRFMLFAGPISTLFDFLTFYVLLRFLQAGEAEFQTGWFVESLCTQVLVLLVVRTMHIPWRSRPSLALILSVTGTVAAGLWLPFSRLGVWFGFTPLPLRYFVFLGVSTLAYLCLVEIAKRPLIRMHATQPWWSISFQTYVKPSATRVQKS